MSQAARLNRKRWQMSVEVGHCRRIRFWVTHGLYSCFFISKHFDFFLSPPLVQNGVPRDRLGPSSSLCLIASLIIHILSFFDNYLTGRAREVIFSRRDEQVSLELRLKRGRWRGRRVPRNTARVIRHSPKVGHPRLGSALRGRPGWGRWRETLMTYSQPYARAAN